MDFIKSLAQTRVVPVAVFNRVEDALRVAELLRKYSFFILEITMRTPVAIECLSAVSREFPDLLLGAGSVLDVVTLDRSADAGARFGVAPCIDDEVVNRSLEIGLPFVPGVSTPSELNRALKRCSVVKVFPSKQLGGPDYIKAVAAPFKMKDFHLVPTGGINEKNYLDYLAVERVVACGMTYVVDGALIGKGDYSALETRMKEIARGLGTSRRSCQLAFIPSITALHRPVFF